MTRPDSHSALGAIPLVSVAITTYNSEKWLPRALHSVLEQRTDFPMEIVISDDCSTDSTVSVALHYRDRYPNLVRVLERSKNVGIMRNYCMAGCRRLLDGPGEIGGPGPDARIGRIDQRMLSFCSVGHERWRRKTRKISFHTSWQLWA